MFLFFLSFRTVLYGTFKKNENLTKLQVQTSLLHHECLQQITAGTRDDTYLIAKFLSINYTLMSCNGAKYHVNWTSRPTADIHRGVFSSKNRPLCTPAYGRDAQLRSYFASLERLRPLISFENIATGQILCESPAVIFCNCF